jgi:hypothetical protein
MLEVQVTMRAWRLTAPMLGRRIDRRTVMRPTQTSNSASVKAAVARRLNWRR